MTPVTLDFVRMQAVVEQQGVLVLAWGGSVSLSPTDDIVIRVERALDLDSEGPAGSVGDFGKSGRRFKAGFN